MLTDIKAFRKRLQERHDARMKPIYAACEKYGLQRRYADSMYYRVYQEPLKQTKALIALFEDGNRYAESNGLKQLKTYLQVMLETYPDHEKAAEWKKSIELIEKYQI